MGNYGVKRLSELSGVSVRTLHHYDKIGLLKPSVRTETKYRQYGEKELLRLQQILFYKELDFPLQEIIRLLDEPEFDMLKALEQHKTALQAKKARMATLLSTLDKTILKLKGTIMLTDEELYKGLPKEKARNYRKEVTDAYGEETLHLAENHLKKLSKKELEELKKQLHHIWENLRSLKASAPESGEVQEWIQKHYYSTRQFWGTFHSTDPQWEAYTGLGKVFLHDERFTKDGNIPDPSFGMFLHKAIEKFVNNQKQYET